MDYYTQKLHDHISGQWPNEYANTIFMHYGDNGPDTSVLAPIVTYAYTGLGSGEFASCFPPTAGVNEGTIDGDQYHVASDGKGETTDEGILTHFLAWGEPLGLGALKGTDCNAVIDASDFYPTILDIIAPNTWRASLGESELAKLDGTSFYDSLFDGGRGEKEYGYYQRFEPGFTEDEDVDIYEYRKAVRWVSLDGTQKYKLSRLFEEDPEFPGVDSNPDITGQPYRFYDLILDPREKNDLRPQLVSTYPELIPIYQDLYAKYSAMYTTQKLPPP